MGKMYLGNRSNAKYITCKSNLKGSESLLESIGAEMVDWAEGGKNNSLLPLCSKYKSSQSTMTSVHSRLYA